MKITFPVSFRHKRKSVIILALMLLLCLAITAITVAVFNSLHSKGGTTALHTSSACSPIVDAGSGVNGSPSRLSRAQLLKELEKQQIQTTINLNPQITVASQTSDTGTWLFQNPAKVTIRRKSGAVKTVVNRVVMQAVLYYKGKQIGITAALKPGQYTEKVSISRQLPAGTYPVTAAVKLYQSLQSSEPINTVTFNNLKYTVR